MKKTRGNKLLSEIFEVPTFSRYLSIHHFVACFEYNIFAKKMSESPSGSLCNLCLVATKSLSRIQSSQHTVFLSRIIGESIEVSSRVEVCWECRYQLLRCITFQEKASECYHLLIKYNAEIKPRWPRLGIFKQDAVSFQPPVDNVEMEFGSTTDLSEHRASKVEIDELPLAQIKRDDPSWNHRLDVKKEENNEWDHKDQLFDSDDSLGLNELEREVKEHMRESPSSRSKKKKRRDKKGRKRKNTQEGSLKLKKRKKSNDNEKIRVIELTQNDLSSERAREAEKDSYKNAEFKCATCIMGFNYAKTFNEHMKTKHDKSKGDYICPVCETVSSSIESFTTHYKRHLTRFECVACGKTTADRKVMNQHYLTNHESDTVKEYKCHCGKISKTLDSHRYHKDSHKARVPCTECDKTFSHRAGLMNHRMSVHKLNNVFPCAECDKVFRWKASLKKHMEKHDKKPRSTYDVPRCDPCGVTFSSIDTLHRHMKISLKHVSESQLKFVCADCNRKFSNKTKLRDHIEEKHLHKSYKCHICNKPSKNRVCLDQHVRNVHKGRPNNKMCHHCGKGFPTKVQLESHIRSHTGERPYICELCPTTFSQQSNLYKHVRQVHMNIKAKGCEAVRRREKPPGAPLQVSGAPVPPQADFRMYTQEVNVLDHAMTRLVTYC